VQLKPLGFWTAVSPWLCLASTSIAKLHTIPDGGNCRPDDKRFLFTYQGAIGVTMLETQQQTETKFPFSFDKSVRMEMPNEDEELVEIPQPNEDEYKRLEGCGSWFAFPDPETGGPKFVQRKCGIVLWCHRCRRELAERELARLQRANDGDPVYKIKVQDDDWEATAKHLKREEIEYRRLPQDDDSSVVFLERDDSYFDDVERVSEFDEQEMETLVRFKPKKKRFSGNLGKKETPPTEKKTGPTVEVKVSQVCSDASAEVQRQAWKKAIEMTSNLLPDEDTLQDALDERAKAYRKALRELGVKILYYRKRTRHVQISRIDWSKSNDNGLIWTSLQVPDGHKGELVPF
jgi:ribosomal protein L44E